MHSHPIIAHDIHDQMRRRGEFAARLERGVSMRESESVTTGMQNSAAETRERSTGAGVQARHDLDGWVQAYAAGRGIGAQALMDMRQNAPAAFRALVEAARAAWTASAEGQRHLTQDGAIAPPRTPEEVFAQGAHGRAKLIEEGGAAVKQEDAANRKTVAGKQHASPDSMPNIEPVKQKVGREQWAAFRAYQASERGAAYQRGAAMLAERVVHDEHGPLAPLRIALSGIPLIGKHVAPESPQAAIQRLDRLAAADPAIRDAIEHLGRQPRPSEEQARRLAEFIEHRAKGAK